MHPAYTIQKIISGGQSGVDRAALDWAIAHGVNHGGWCPKGRRAGDGILDPRYRLQETDSEGYRQRTRRNVADSDGTLILYPGSLTGGSLLTQSLVCKLKKPLLMLSVCDPLQPQRQVFLNWIEAFGVRTLNIAGPSEKTCPWIYAASFQRIDGLFAPGR